MIFETDTKYFCHGCLTRHKEVGMASINLHNQGICKGCEERLTKKQKPKPGNAKDKKAKALYAQGKVPWFKY